MDANILAQACMVITLVLMISGITPLYLTAGLGSALAALLAGIPLAGGADVTVTKLINSGLNPVIADMSGVLLFIGVMEFSGFLDIIIKSIIRAGRVIGGGPGVATAGGIAAGAIGALTGFTQPAITATITGPAAVKLGVDPNKAAGISAHAGHLGNFGGFTHPTQLSIIAMAGLSFGAINLVGTIVGLSVFAISFFRVIRGKKGSDSLSAEDAARLSDELATGNSGSVFLAYVPFLVLIAGFAAGFPVFLVGMVAGALTLVLARCNPRDAEASMLSGVGKVATPLVATITFLFMASVIRNIGLVDLIGRLVDPVLSLAPIQILLLVSALTGFLTQSYGASAAIILPMLSVVLAGGANPLAAAVAAAGGASLMQYFLTGGPVAALATVIPVVPGSELRAANRFQRPSILGGVLVVLLITLIL